MKPDVIDDFVEEFWILLGSVNEICNIQEAIKFRYRIDDIEDVKNIWRLQLNESHSSNLENSTSPLYRGKPFFQFVSIQNELHGLKISSLKTA